MLNIFYQQSGEIKIFIELIITSYFKIATKCFLRFDETKIL